VLRYHEASSGAAILSVDLQLPSWDIGSALARELHSLLRDTRLRPTERLRRALDILDERKVPVVCREDAFQDDYYTARPQVSWQQILESIQGGTKEDQAAGHLVSATLRPIGDGLYAADIPAEALGTDGSLAVELSHEEGTEAV
jgi:hypothetical protein